ncbi:MAG: 4Fe-4S ferredoxin [Thermoprotei archaeon]|nr:MAG: 4Fe-4S ferredoxin [Thermoprotei archaeon]
MKVNYVDYCVYRRLMTVNVSGKRIRRNPRILIYGTCVRDEYPDLFSKLASGRIPLAVCMEDEHMNMVALKLASIASRVKLEEVVVLTVDGSPHCIQLHMAVEEVSKIVGGLPVKHYVVEKGVLWEIDPHIVKIARYLHRVKKLYDKSLQSQAT